MLLLPLIAAAVILLGARRSGNISALISVGSSAVCFIAALMFLGYDVSEGAKVIPLYTWAAIGDLNLNIGFHVDRLSQGMMFVVTFIGMLVHVFSLVYMKDDEGKARYFAGLSIFMFSMTGIVLADNLAMMFIFWELVGVSSYILIGHWFHKNSAADASKKAFLTNRIGDFGFMIGILMIWQIGGSINFTDLAGAGNAGNEALQGYAGTGMLTAAVLLIFCGAVGKSAQMPLHVWLPDAMEGPTPVSALIHAATMVAAGVYMMARVIFLVDLAPTAGEVIGWVGGITALLAALMATQQSDIKKILAYSTLSQLGYMIMVVGLGGQAGGGDVAGMFHLFTHAFFKALLFLGAGAIIYACHHEQNIWKMGGLSKKMPITFATFVCGTAALIAVPYITSGFYSKEEILTVAWNNNEALFVIASIVAFLTAFYMVRLFTVVFLGKAKDKHSEEAKEVGPLMFVPLGILAVLALVAGFGFVTGPTGAMAPQNPDHPSIVLIVSILTVIAGAGLGFVCYRDKKEEPYPIKLFANKFYLDEIYLTLVRIFQDAAAWVIKGFDYLIIDILGVRGSAGIASGLGSLFRKLQLGNIQGYAFLFGLGVILLIYFAVFAG